MTAAFSRPAAAGARHADSRTAALRPPFPTFANGAWLLVLTALLSGCAGGGASNDSTPGLNVANNNWFCQMAESGEGWDCVEDEKLVRRPRPTRLPGSTASSPAAEGAAAASTGSQPAPGEAVAVPSPPAGTRDVSLTLAPVPVAPEPLAAGGERRSAEELPTHVRLAYQPSKPTLLEDLPSEFFTVQLLAMSSKTTLEAYVRDHGLKGLSAARIENDGGLYYVLLLGVYETEALARQAAADLPPPLDEASPWIRPLGSLQEAMQRADQLAGSPRL